MKPGHDDAVLIRDCLNAFGERAIADFDGFSDERRVEEVQLVVDPQRQAGVGDVEPFDRARCRDDVTVSDLTRDLGDVFLRYVVPALPAQSALDDFDVFECSRIFELSIRIRMRGHEIDRLRVKYPSKIYRNVRQQTLSFVIGDPLTEIV